MISTSIQLGYEASEAWIMQGFDSDERIPTLVAREFNKIAANHGISASLNVYTSSVDIDVDELEMLPEDEDECESCLCRWLDEAIENIQERWMNDEL